MPSQSLPPESEPFTAAIVGAGIAGLSAAIALRRARFRVDVYERSKFANEIGAAISAPPNATIVLREWGFDFAAAGVVPNLCTRYASGRDLEILSESRYEDIEAVMGAPSFSFHRVDLHRGLRNLATEDKGDDPNVGVPVEIHLGCAVRSVDCENGIVTLVDGNEIQRDLVIIADGAHSSLLADFLGHPAPAQPTGRSIYRWLVSMEDVMADPELALQYRNKLPGFLGWFDAAKHILWVNYACRGETVLNNAVVHDTEHHASQSQSDDDNSCELDNSVHHEQTQGERDISWHALASKETVLATLSNFHPAARRIVSMASEDGIKVHQLLKRPPLESFVRGRTAVIGDAAHVMLPTHAAGCAVAIESAGVLEVLFKGSMGDDTVPENDSHQGREQLIRQRLRLFDKLRIPRCNLTMLVSNAGPEGLNIPGVEEEIRRFYQGPLPSEGARPWSDEFREVLFHYNAFHEATRALSDERSGAEVG
ncbi:FAD/NAD(P)-binding domain-containing protein [Xylaria sp. CBS 124048]|nr:FAD/NAD(P)-binding domain-containing protein [Xylaria sp. CBS 124048]